jgi:hypothetical protein
MGLTFYIFGAESNKIGARTSEWNSIDLEIAKDSGSGVPPLSVSVRAQRAKLKSRRDDLKIALGKDAFLFWIGASATRGHTAKGFIPLSPSDGAERRGEELKPVSLQFMKRGFLN